MSDVFGHRSSDFIVERFLVKVRTIALNLVSEPVAPTFLQWREGRMTASPNSAFPHLRSVSAGCVSRVTAVELVSLLLEKSVIAFTVYTVMNQGDSFETSAMNSKNCKHRTHPLKQLVPAATSSPGVEIRTS